MKNLLFILISIYGLFAFAAKTTIICGYVDNFANVPLSYEKNLKKDNTYPLTIVSSKTREMFELVETDDLLAENPDLEKGSVQKLLCIKGEFVGESKLRVIDSWETK